MKIRTPYDRDNLKIKKSFKVLEIGSGHAPSFRSDVLVEKFIYDNYNRCGNVKIYPHQLIYNASGENLPFADKEFDYVICNQVLEHAEDPAAFISEICRVGKRGYIETPSLLGEFLFPKESHKWVILDIDNTLEMYKKCKMNDDYNQNYGELFLNYLPYQSLTYKLLWLTEGNIMLNRYEWEDSVDFIVNPDQLEYLSYFTKPWNRQMTQRLYPQRSIGIEIKKVLSAILYLVKSEFRHKVLYKNKRPISLEQYLDMGKKFCK